ncbi:ABC transporter ATP-binding protein [Streptococcus acidominimus]|uniref:ABC transporter ATP-binding protein n=1 Tax=Streptococcus acidominimus TaxID=1326 RepID=A0A4Y9FNI3_STRAI|nr:ABC transporter ATP-binding protein [Streptococcus acidominimus]MBF0819020.1 ABC transporter ATP-binding protein [Streptococcus acidominimus]MBF0837971.1 ABC transporter ATP-binding protein [Streptococcus acidominimus]MBF0847666.1 ABC transporter ATP-binding protein [Streptococcus danieliae]TFU30432.1 ABC transporter ATP-binding protein [Streptococcus acidominimus]
MVDVITCQQLTKFYQENKALDGLDIEIKKGQITAILGRNGSGKTTLIKLLLNMISPTSGQIFYEDCPVGKLGHGLYRRTAAILESVDNTYDYMTGKENIDYFSGLLGQRAAFSSPKVQELLDRLTLQDAIHSPAGGYSRGMRQKLALIIALLSDADILFLDEPTLGLDFESCRAIADTLKWLVQTEGKTIILTSHQADLIEELADRVILLDKGKLLFSGDLASFKAKNKHESQYMLTCKEGEFNKGRATMVDGAYQFLFASHEELSLWLQGHPDCLPFVTKIEEMNQRIDDVLSHFYKEELYD